MAVEADSWLGLRDREALASSMADCVVCFFCFGACVGLLSQASSAGTATGATASRRAASVSVSSEALGTATAVWRRMSVSLAMFARRRRKGILAGDGHGTRRRRAAWICVAAGWMDGCTRWRRPAAAAAASVAGPRCSQSTSVPWPGEARFGGRRWDNGTRDGIRDGHEPDSLLAADHYHLRGRVDGACWKTQTRRRRG